MRDPLRRLKFLPWRSLIQAALLTVLLVDLPISLALRLGLQLMTESPDLPIATLLATLFRPPLGILVDIAIIVAVGAVAVYILERLDRISISAGSLWALVLCLEIALVLEQLLLSGAANLNEVQLVGIIVGVFWRGRPYWKSFKRW